jgi:hypothetical protein
MAAARVVKPVRQQTSRAAIDAPPLCLRSTQSVCLRSTQSEKDNNAWRVSRIWQPKKNPSIQGAHRQSWPGAGSHRLARNDRTPLKLGAVQQPNQQLFRQNQVGKERIQVLRLTARRTNQRVRRYRRLMSSPRASVCRSVYFRVPDSPKTTKSGVRWRSRRVCQLPSARPPARSV